MSLRGAITYDGLPIARGGAHRLRTRGFVAGQAALARFVAAVALEREPVALAVEAISPPGLREPRLDGLTTALDARYPRLRARAIGAYRGRRWTAPTTALAALAEDLERAGPFPDAGHAGPAVAIHATWRLTLLDPASGRPLSHQSADDHRGFKVDADRRLGVSRLYARIAGRTTANLFLSLPFEAPSEAARRLAAHIQAAFPARLSANHWKLWRPGKAGTGYVGRRIEALV